MFNSTWWDSKLTIKASIDPHPRLMLCGVSTPIFISMSRLQSEGEPRQKQTRTHLQRNIHKRKDMKIRKKNFFFHSRGATLVWVCCILSVKGLIQDDDWFTLTKSAHMKSVLLLCDQPGWTLALFDWGFIDIFVIWVLWTFMCDTGRLRPSGDEECDD